MLFLTCANVGRPHGKPHSGSAPHGKAHSAPVVSRKTAFCAGDATEKRILRRRRHLDVTKRRILGGRRHGKPHFACGPHQKAHSVCERWRRVRLSVRVRAQNALFCRMCFSLPAQTSGGLTERRTLHPATYGKAHSGRAAHVKAHSATAGSRKTALCAGNATCTGDATCADDATRRYTSRAPYGR